MTVTRYYSNVHEELFKFQQTGYLCDTVLTANGKIMVAHSVLLSATCPVMKSAIGANIAIGSVAPYYITLPDIGADLLEIIIQFIYTGNLSLPEKLANFVDLQRVLYAFDSLKIEHTVLNGSVMQFKRYVYVV